MGVTGVDRLELVVSPAIRSMLRLVRSVCLWFGLMGRTFDQTASIGSVTGVTLAPSGAVLPGVGVDLSKKGGGERKSATSDENGRFGFPLLPPGKYELQASKQDFEPLSSSGNNHPYHGNSSSRAASSARDALRACASVIKPAL